MILRRPMAGLTGQIPVITGGFDVTLLFMAPGANLGAGILHLFGCFPFCGDSLLQRRIC